VAWLNNETQTLIEATSRLIALEYPQSNARPLLGKKAAVNFGPKGRTDTTPPMSRIHVECVDLTDIYGGVWISRRTIAKPSNDLSVSLSDNHRLGLEPFPPGYQSSLDGQVV
jgi:hypothetical protein